MGSSSSSTPLLEDDAITLTSESLNIGKGAWPLLDILGARAAGLQAVLLTGYGLFSDGGAHDTIRACGIVPDWIVATL